MQNPYLVFQIEHNDEMFSEAKNIEQGSSITHIDQNPPFSRIKNRRIKHKRNFGRGANHPSFFLRKFFYKLTCDKYQKIYSEFPQIRKKILAQSQSLRKDKNRFKLQDLRETFGVGKEVGEEMQKYLNSKMFFKAISQSSLEMIMEESKCSHVLNHLISIEKYSSRLANPALAGRVEFQ